LLLPPTLPLPEVDPKTLPKFVEGELKLWDPASETRPADTSEDSLRLELNRLPWIGAPINKLDF
jgi:hypothetical protein